MMQLVYDAARLLTAAVTRSIIFILQYDFWWKNRLCFIIFIISTTTTITFTNTDTSTN